MPEDSGLCVICFYYHSLPGGATEFWKRKNEYLFPYNIGARLMNNRFGIR